MAEVVGLITSIITVIEGISKANGLVRRYVHTNSSIRSELIPMLAKLTAFSGLLQAVKLEAEFEEYEEGRLKVLTHIDGPLHACKDAAKLIQNRLDRIISVGKLGFGKVLDKECVQALNILDQTKPILELALVADQRTLLTSIESNTQSITEQLKELRTESCDSLRRLDEKSASIESHIIKIESAKEDSANLKRQEQILIWTSSLNHRANYNAARNQTAGMPGTGCWFIDSDYFRQWMDPSLDQNAILLHGISGSGKSVLCSTIINEVLQRTSSSDDVQVAYFFFDFNDPAKQTVDGMIRSLVFQLSLSADDAPKPLAELYHRHHREKECPTLPTVQEWISVLLCILDTRESIFIVIDALDECEEHEQLIESIGDIVAQSGKPIRWLFTCQIPDATLKYTSFTIVRIETSAVDSDITTYLHATLKIDPILRSYSDKAKSMIEHAILSKAQGMFRWAQCQIAALRQLKDRRPKTVQLVLSRMPEDLYSSYERTLIHLCQLDQTTSVSNGELVYRILLFVTFSGRPVTVAEAAEFAVIEGSRKQTNVDNRFEDPMAILTFLGTLVSTQDSILTLAHKSVKDFLESPRAQSGPLQIGLFLERHNQCALEPDMIGHAADIFIARGCLSYLSRPHLTARQMSFTGVMKDPNTSYLGRLNKANPLLDYAARMWLFHLREPLSQHNARYFLYDAMQSNDQGQPTLWQGWLFLQPADIWERQLQLAGFLCECFIRSSLLDGWANNFWYFRQTYRVINSPSMNVEPEKPCEIDSLPSKNIKPVLGPVSRQYLDLAVLLLEVGLQRPLYSQHQEELFATSRTSTVNTYIKRLEQLSKSVIPRMGEGYHTAVYGCMQHIVVGEEDPLDARPMFEKQTEAMDTILQPLRSSAASGFRRSQGVGWINGATKNLLIKTQPNSQGPSWLRDLENASVPKENQFSRTHRSDGTMLKSSYSNNTRWSSAQASARFQEPDNYRWSALTSPSYVKK